MHVAIIGGGLSGIALAIALQRRKITFTIYETRSSFTEVGAGINIGPTAVQSLRIIDPSLGKTVYELATRNPEPNEETFFLFRYGAAHRGRGGPTPPPSPPHQHQQHAQEGDFICEFGCPPTGAMMLHRQDFLKALADQLMESVPVPIAGATTRNTTKEEIRRRPLAVFNKKLVSYAQDANGVELRFADGETARADVLVGCDGIHSSVRKYMFSDPAKLERMKLYTVFSGSMPEEAEEEAIFGEYRKGGDNDGEKKIHPVAQPHYFNEAAYRAILPMEKVLPILGQYAGRSMIFFGPQAYIIMYPVNKGKNINCGAWVRRPGPWSRYSSKRGQSGDPRKTGNEWIVPNQYQNMLEEFKEWNPMILSILKLFPKGRALDEDGSEGMNSNANSAPDTTLRSAHQHSIQPTSCRDGRVILIGDAAHAMPPHQGSGAGTAVEDAAVLAEVLSELVSRKEDWNGVVEEGTMVDTALRAVEEIRIPRSSEIHRLSVEAAERWFGAWDVAQEGDEMNEWVEESIRRFKWIWKADMRVEVDKAKARFGDLLSSVLHGEKMV